MTAIEKIREFVEAYSGFDILNSFNVDYTDRIPANAGVFPSGIVELRRVHDVLGNVEIENQLNAAIYIVLKKDPGNDELAQINADWVLDFQDYVQRASFLHEHPVFGDCPGSEIIMATEGRLYDASEEGVAVYAVQLSVRYTKIYKKP